MTATQRLVNVLKTLRTTQERLEDYGKSHAEVDDQIRQIEGDLQELLHSEDSPLVELVKAFEQVQRVETYLFNSTYANSGSFYGLNWAAWYSGSFYGLNWAAWYDDIASAVELLREHEQLLRAEIAKRIGASIQ
jgi:hypothetical protein